MVYDYTPEKDGAIVAIHIYLFNGYQPMAELLPAFGGSYTIRWDCVEDRKIFLKGINAYTIIYDDRALMVDFNSHKRTKY